MNPKCLLCCQRIEFTLQANATFQNTFQLTYVYIETYVYIYGRSTCKSFIIAALFPRSHAQCSYSRIENAGTKKRNKKNSNKKAHKKIVKIGVVCWFCFVSAVRKQRLELLSVRAERERERRHDRRQRESLKREAQTKRRMKMTSLLTQHWGTRPKLGLEELFSILCNLEFLSRTFLKYFV